jgi:WD40 repeat protein
MAAASVSLLGTLANGHEDSVTCVAPQILSHKDNGKESKKAKQKSRRPQSLPRWTGVLASGGEEGHFTFWDPLRSCTPTSIMPLKEEITSIAFHPESSWRVFVSAGSDVYELDTRKLQEGKAITHFQMEDDINEICVHSNGNFLAACDDTGAVKIFDLLRRAPFKTLRKHTNICSTVQFRPRCAWELCSGGLDYSLHYVDFSNGSTLQHFDFNEKAEPSALCQTQIFNPPFVHSLRFSDGGEYLGVGLGNGTSIIYETQRRHLKQAHSSSFRLTPISQFHFLSLGETTYSLTAGDDGVIDIWDFRKSNDQVSAPPIQVKHGEKINWISCVAEFVFVADITNALRFYKLSV